ncbi:MAG: carboxylate-amine ligase [Candidatus Latescibacteria bacterium]|jgi:glutamate---cysteine ligase / carboxylate-amine ligase|nr:carboxylate-amine ligase [Candidatus Latescibacterota bacterium]
MNPEELTLGIEEEYQIIDPHTRELTSYVSEFLEKGRMVFRDQVKPEFLQSQIEIGSKVCRDISEARQEVSRLRRMVCEIGDKSGHKIVAAGTHPFSRWQEQDITEKDRYRSLVADLQYIARRLLVFGTHIHVAVPNRELRIDVMNQVCYFLPHILALSTSSPFWLGENTGLKSYRSVVFADLPRTGLPEPFDSADEYEHYVQTLVHTGCIDEPTKIWWDVRPHPRFPTLEFRICDCVTTIDEVMAIAALIQAVVAKLIQLRRKNQSWRTYRHMLIAENKWRSIKDGLDGKLVDFGKDEEVPVRTLIEELLEIIDDVVEPLGIRREIDYIETMLEIGTSADRQLKIFTETGSVEAVVDHLAVETVAGC